MSPFFEGNKALYREVKPEDIELSREWFNDKNVTKYLYRGAFPFHEKEAAKTYSFEQRDPGENIFTITSMDGKAIGVVGLHSIHWISRIGEYRVLIGDKDFWGKGIGMESLQFIAAHAFEVLNLNKVYLGVNAEHLAARKSYVAAGFVEEGILRQEYYRSNQYFDVCRMGMLKDEYYEKKSSWDLANKIKEQYPLS